MSCVLLLLSLLLSLLVQKSGCFGGGADAGARGGGSIHSCTDSLIHSFISIEFMSFHVHFISCHFMSFYFISFRLLCISFHFILFSFLSLPFHSIAFHSIPFHSISFLFFYFIHPFTHTHSLSVLWSIHIACSCGTYPHFGTKRSTHTWS